MRADFLEFLIAHEPEVLLRSDVAANTGQAQDQLVTSSWSGRRTKGALMRGNSKIFAGLKHSLAQQLWKYISDRSLGG